MEYQDILQTSTIERKTLAIVIYFFGPTEAVASATYREDSTGERKFFHYHFPDSSDIQLEALEE